MYCRHCGKESDEGEKFCTNCGSAFYDSKSSKSVTSWFSKYRSLIIILGALVLLLILSMFLLYWGGSSVSTKSAENSNRLAVVDVLCDNSEGGSGTIFSTDGTVLTNNHVVAGAKKCQITIPDPDTGQIAEIYDATPVITPVISLEYDIATLKIDGPYKDSDGKVWGPYPSTFTAFTSPSICNLNENSKLGDAIRIYGYPVTSGGYNLTITDGIISSFANNGNILTSAKIDSGNSGGLAVDQNGCWLGIPSAVVSGNYQNLGVIIPGAAVENILSSIPAKSQAIAPVPQSNDDICQNSYGDNSKWSGSLSKDGTPTCSCQSGYSWDATGDVCASKTSLNSSCQDNYGIGSYSYTSDGKAVCGCNTGYEWNSAGTACVAKVQESGYDVCSETYANETWNGTYGSNGKYNCVCRFGYDWNESSNACAPALTPDEICQKDVGYWSSYLGYKNADGTYACSDPN